MKETMYSKDLKEAFPKYAVVLQDMQNYDLNRKKPAAKQESTAPVGPTIPSTTTCLTCSKIFNKVMKKNDPGEFFKHCYACSAKHREARDTAAATPTPAQVKKAQAVILAARIADPIIPPITQREVNSINNYMDSQYYSLATTTTTTTTAPPTAAPTTTTSTTSTTTTTTPSYSPCRILHS